MSLRASGTKPRRASAAPDDAAPRPALSILTGDGELTSENPGSSSGQAEGARKDRVQPAPGPLSAVSVDAPRTNAIPVGSRRLCVLVAAKFTLAMTFTIVWVSLSVWISAGWVPGLDLRRGPGRSRGGHANAGRRDGRCADLRRLRRPGRLEL
jgi:hypothetical protein